MSVILNEVDYKHCPFCNDDMSLTYGGDWNPFMEDIYERYDYSKGDKRYYYKHCRFMFCAKCHKEIKFGDLKPIVP
jgi:hypothetical protein